MPEGITPLEVMTAAKEHQDKIEAEAAGASSNIEDYHKMFDKQAEQQNTYRKWYEKLLGVGKKERADVIQKRVEAYDKALGLELSSGNSKSVVEAVNKVEDRAEFQLKSPEKVEQTEFANNRLLIVANSLDKNNFSLAAEKASALLGKIELSKKIDIETKEEFTRKLSQLIIGKANDLLLGKEYENFVAIVENMPRLKKFSSKDFKNISPEIMNAPELVAAVKQTVIKEVRHGAQSFVNARGRWENLVLVDREEINKLPEVVDTAKSKIIEWAFNASYFTQERKKWVEAGVVSMEEANKLPEVVDTAKSKIIEWAFNASYFTQERKKWVEAGVFSPEEVNQFPEIIEMVKQNIASSYDKKNETAKWAKAGVVLTKETVGSPQS